MSQQHNDPVVIVSAARTPMGAFQGDFAELSANDLGGAAIKAAVDALMNAMHPISQKSYAKAHAAQGNTAGAETNTDNGDSNGGTTVDAEFHEEDNQ